MLSLEINRREALGLLTLLWDWTGQYAPRGNIGRYPDEQIAKAVEWPIDKSKPLIKALVKAGWLDRDHEHRLLVHHWHTHSEQWVKKRLANTGESCIERPANGKPPPTPTISDGRPTDSQRIADGCPALPSPAKPIPALPSLSPKAAEPPDQVLFPEVLDTAQFKAAWAEYTTYRKESKLKKLTPRSVKAKWKELAADGHDNAIESIRATIANGWQGLFGPGKGGGGATGTARQSPQQRRAAKIERDGRDHSGEARII